GERVHDAHTHAVQPAGDLVAALVELAARVQHRHRQLDARQLLGRMDVDRDAAPVVDDGDGVIGVDRDVDLRAEAGERLVDRVVDDLVDEVVQPARPCRADVHAGALPDRLEALQHLDLPCVVAVLRLALRHGPWSSSWEYCQTSLIPLARARVHARAPTRAYRAREAPMARRPSRTLRLRQA